MNQVVFAFITFGVFMQIVCTIADDTKCIAAVATINFTCTAQLSTGYTPVCSGSCAPLMTAVNNTCASSTDTDAQTFVRAYNSLCGGANCIAAGEALIANSYCSNAISSKNYPAYCGQTCKTLIDDVINSCNYQSSEALTNILSNVDTGCGSGSAIKASAIIILLVVAINTFIL